MDETRLLQLLHAVKAVPTFDALCASTHARMEAAAPSRSLYVMSYDVFGGALVALLLATFCYWRFRAVLQRHLMRKQQRQVLSHLPHVTAEDIERLVGVVSPYPGYLNGVVQLPYKSSIREFTCEVVPAVYSTASPCCTLSDAPQLQLLGWLVVYC